MIFNIDMCRTCFLEKNDALQPTSQTVPATGQFGSVTWQYEQIMCHGPMGSDNSLDRDDIAVAWPKRTDAIDGSRLLGAASSRYPN
jgi:hypothetical protein